MLVRTLTAAIVTGVLIVVSAAPVASAECVPSSNLAECAVASADSDNPDTEQTAGKAIDGVAGGYPGDYTTEWATLGGNVDSALMLTWPSTQRVGSVVLVDRPNADDDITGGTLTFSDGSVVMVPALPEDGEPLTLEFSARDTTSLLFTVTSVSDTTYNIGLSELFVYAPPAVASLLGAERNFAEEGGVVRIVPRAVSSVDETDGIRLVRVELELETLAGMVEPNQSWFAMLGADGTRYLPIDDPADDSADPIGDVVLEEGEVLTGTVHFEIPADGSGFLIGFVPEAEGEPVATWSLNAP